MTQSDAKRFLPLDNLCRHLSEGSYEQIPANFMFEYDTSGANHGLHGYFELSRILNQLNSSGVNCRKLTAGSDEHILKYELNY